MFHSYFHTTDTRVQMFETRFILYALDMTSEVIWTEYGQRIHKHPEAGYIQLTSQYKYINDEG